MQKSVKSAGSALHLFADSPVPAPRRAASTPTYAAGGAPRWVDLFAGGGGASAGIEAAGHRVIAALNHSPVAVEWHARNHPDTWHDCQDLNQYDFRQLPEYDVLWASPCCQGFSTAPTRVRAKDRHFHDAARATTYATLDAIARTRPRAFVVENVTAFRRWGPGANGAAYRHWRAGLELWGYDLAEYVIQATDYGASSARERLFVVGVGGGRSAAGLDLGQLDRTGCAARILDEVPGDSPRWHRWTDHRSAAIRGQCERGRARHGARFISQNVTGHSGRALRSPLPTLTARGAGQLSLIDGDRRRLLSVRELARAMGFADSHQLPVGSTAGTRLVGNAVSPPVAERLARAVEARL